MIFSRSIPVSPSTFRSLAMTSIETLEGAGPFRIAREAVCGRDRHQPARQPGVWSKRDENGTNSLIGGCADSSSTTRTTAKRRLWERFSGASTPTRRRCSDTKQHGGACGSTTRAQGAGGDDEEGLRQTVFERSRGRCAISRGCPNSRVTIVLEFFVVAPY